MRSLVRVAETAWYRIRGFYPAVVHGVDLRCDADHIKFWKLAARGHWEPQTFEILDRFLRPDSNYCDIGAWIGPDVLYAANRCRMVYCFEPDRIAYEYLLRNIRLNRLRNVRPFSIALSDSDGVRDMSSFGTDLGDSMTSVLNPKEGDSVQVLCMRWATWLSAAAPGDLHFMKMDIEGGEFSLLPTMADYLARHKPAVYLSTHAPFLDPGERRQRMQQISEVMRVYANCIDHDLRPVPHSTLTDEDTLTNFRSFVFFD
jgi:FkbM family methyltransferase